MSTDQKLDKILETQSNHSVTLGKMEVDLKHHIKRSDNHEVYLQKQDKSITKIWYVLIAGAAAGITEYGTIIIKFLGGIL
jgi:L-lactate utilization protein LutC